jgi:hypothetical protein
VVLKSPHRSSSRHAELLARFETLAKIVVLTIFNVLVMVGIFGLAKNGIWRNPEDSLEGLYPLFAIGCGWVIFSFAQSIRLWLRHEYDKAIRIAVRVVPATVVALMGVAAALAIIGGIVVIAAPFFGFEIPCAFKWPRCS